jgi:hypothetical protein
MVPVVFMAPKFTDTDGWELKRRLYDRTLFDDCRVFTLGSIWHQLGVRFMHHMPARIRSVINYPVKLVDFDDWVKYMSTQTVKVDQAALRKHGCLGVKRMDYAWGIWAGVI